MPLSVGEIKGSIPCEAQKEYHYGKNLQRKQQNNYGGR